MLMHMSQHNPYIIHPYILHNLIASLYRSQQAEQGEPDAFEFAPVIGDELE